MTRSSRDRAPQLTQDHLDDLVSALLTASRVLVGISARSLADLEEAVTIPQFRALAVLDAYGEIHLNRVADILGVNPSSAMRMVDRLLAMDLVTRRENPDNRRHTLIGLSPDGAKLVRKVTARRRREIRKVVARMPDGHRPEFIEALRAFAAAGGEPDAEVTRSWL
jgi:DNA-binding MarR family transcriptional regulator